MLLCVEVMLYVILYFGFILGFSHSFDVFMRFVSISLQQCP